MSETCRKVYLSYQHNDQMKARDFTLLWGDKGVGVEFVERHLPDHVDSTNKKYIDAKIREQIKGTSVTVVFIGRDLHKSEYQLFEVQESLSKEKPNGILAIMLDKDVRLYASELGSLLYNTGTEIIEWPPGEVGEAIERAAIAAGRAAMVRSTPTGGSRCIR